MSREEKLSGRRQCELVDISRSLFYYLPKGELEENLQIMRKLDEFYMEDSTAGSRRMRDYLRRNGQRLYVSVCGNGRAFPQDPGLGTVQHA